MRGRAERLAKRASPRRRRVRRRLDRTTIMIGVLALASAAGAVAGEVGRVWRRGSAPLPTEADDMLAAAEEAVSQAAEVAVAGYRAASERENALLNLLVAFVLTFGMVRTATLIIRRWGQFGPFREVVIGNRHIHHFVPGIVIALLSGAAGLVTRDERVDKWLAIPFGMGAALTLDESALLLELEDVYWTPEGLLSVQITMATMALLAALALGARLLRRGERLVLEDGDAARTYRPSVG